MYEYLPLTATAHLLQIQKAVFPPSLLLIKRCRVIRIKRGVSVTQSGTGDAEWASTVPCQRIPAPLQEASLEY